MRKLISRILTKADKQANLEFPLSKSAPQTLVDLTLGLENYRCVSKKIFLDNTKDLSGLDKAGQKNIGKDHK